MPSAWPTSYDWEQSDLAAGRAYRYGFLPEHNLPLAKHAHRRTGHGRLPGDTTAEDRGNIQPDPAANAQPAAAGPEIMTSGVAYALTNERQDLS